MKKSFREKAMLILGIIIYLPYCAVTTFCIYIFFYFRAEWTVQFFCVAIISILFLLIEGAYLHYSLLGERCFGKLTVYEDKVRWSCPTFRSVEIYYDDITHVSIEDFENLNRGMPVIRGDEISFICLSTSAIPAKYRGKITTYRNKKGFIKFKYMDNACEALMEALPPEKQGPLRGFYAEMQLSDEKIAKEKAKRKRRKKREKEVKARRKARTKDKQRE